MKVADPDHYRQQVLPVLRAPTGSVVGCPDLSIPASNNAGLQSAPDQISAIAGLRGMFRQSGGIIAVSITTTLLAHSTDPGGTQAHTFTIFAAVLLLIVPFTFLVPDHRGSW
ncbi:hypothetical protein [Kribbella qitaiheensis]|uniref:hypothetical protein n=1 Tax=Kribbella qitaiheensis TaxID=1544730 RepID=UPI0016241294|nr:hypothetical protein [Kribbella qitaiheensis]